MSANENISYCEVVRGSRHYKELHELALSGGGTARDTAQVWSIGCVRRRPSGATASVDADEPQGVRA